MVSTFTSNKNIEQPAHNDYVNTWDVPVNADWSQIDKAFGNSTPLNATALSGNQTLTPTQYVPLTLIVSGTPTAAITYVMPAGVGGQWVFANATTGGFNVGIASAAGGTTILCPAGANTLVSCDGSATGMRLSITTTPPAGGSNTQVQFNNLGLLAGSPNFTFDGTTASPVGLNVRGNSVLGSGPGSATTLVGSAVSAPNNLVINTSQFFVNTTTGNVGIGTITPGSLLSVAGNVESTSGGFKFPDGTVQTTAAGSGGLHFTGVILAFAGATAPTGSLLCNGQAVSRTTFAALFAIIGTTYGAGNGSTTFNVPDLRGTVVAGLDNMGGVASAGRLSNVMASTTLGGALSNGALNSSGVNVSGVVGVNFGNLGFTFTGGNGHITNNTVGGLSFGGGGVASQSGDPVAIDQVFGFTSVNGNFGVNSSGGTNNFNIAQSTMVMNYIIVT